MPVAIDRPTAASSASDAGAVALIVATAGWIAFAVTQSIPASNCETVPVSAQSSTRTDTSETAGALPLVTPPIAPATSVPWSSHSWPDARCEHRVNTQRRPSLKVGVGVSNAPVDQVHAHTRAGRGMLILVVER